ncbi:MAG TPA: glycosyltransferase family 2 protein [Leptospiraceae bacterium]|nr:glycosyltransferase family 2 protein [Leptospiraceae bacterium]HNL74333.1 glycosyltransferase family 2 protein [Leptospiraceae bacterium]
MNKKIFIITPVLNEEPNMERLLSGWKSIQKDLKDFDFEFILIDDGSTDNTVSKAKSVKENLNLTILSHEKNQGPGYAFGTGFEYLAGKLQPHDLVVTMEGDNTSRIDTFTKLVYRQLREGDDVVLASPYAYGGGMTNTAWYRIILSHIANGMVKELIGIHGIHTMSSFFRVHTGEIILRLQSKFGKRIIERRGFESMIEMLKKLILVNASMSEVAMKLDTSLRAGKSKMKIMRTIRGYFKLFMISRKWKV